MNVFFILHRSVANIKYLYKKSRKLILPVQKEVLRILAKFLFIVNVYIIVIFRNSENTKKASNSFYWKRTIIVRSKPITADSSLLLTVPKILPNPCLFAQAMIIRMQTRITLVIYSYHRCMSFSVTYLFIRS